ncbi:MAG: YCF48-related protein [Ignavibacteria bacterium]|jgi:photosystem II stability/assembly factor-like uncharacterized protein
MKNFFYLLILVLFTYSASYSQISWTQQSSGTFENLNGIFLINANTGYAVGNNGVVLKTTNSGQTWVLKSFPVSTHNLSIYFQNALTGFIGNQNANIYKTVDGGNTWEVNGSASTYAITSISMPSTSAGYCGDHYSNIQKSTDNGQAWWTVATTPGWDAKIYFMNENRGWSVDTYGYIYSTSNAGTNWSSKRISTDTLSSVSFLTSTIGYVAGDSGRVFKTTNGGTNWTLLNTGTTAKLNCIYVTTFNFIYAVGNSGTILYSTNDGNNWTIQTPTAQNLNSINFVPGTMLGSITGNFGTIYRTNDSLNWCIGAETIQSNYPFTTNYMDARTDILFTASELVSNGASPGYIYKIGFQVTSIPSNSFPMNNFKVKFQNTMLTSLSTFTNSGWTTVYSGTYTVAGTGLQYITLPTLFFWNGTSNLLIEICYNNNSYLINSNVNSSTAPGKTITQFDNLPSGDGCTDLNTGTVMPLRPNICFVTQVISGENNNKKLIPDKFYLSQNYPNPFNPVTKIKYGLPKQSYVTLKIYDLLGRELKTLVNEQTQAGEYIVDFDGSDLSSGTYFYKLEAGSYTETRKLLLIK